MMKRILAGLIILFFCLCSCTAKNQTTGDVKMEEKEIIERYTAIQQAMVDKDIKTLDALIIDGTTFRHMSGVVQSKAEYFHDIETDRLDYQSFTISDPKVSMDGDNAVLKARVVLTANAYGSQGSWPFNVSVHFVKIGGSWYMTN